MKHMSCVSPQSPGRSHVNYVVLHSAHLNELFFLYEGGIVNCCTIVFHERLIHSTYILAYLLKV
jgi:hypothetical protein